MNILENYKPGYYLAHWRNDRNASLEIVYLNAMGLVYVTGNERAFRPEDFRLRLRLGDNFLRGLVDAPEYVKSETVGC